MIPISQEEKEVWNNGGQKYLKLEFSDGTVIDNESIQSEAFSIEQSICDERDLKYGKCCAAELKVKIKANVKAYKGLKFNCSISTSEDENADDYYCKSLGVFTVYSDNRTEDKLYRDIVAYDDVYRISNIDVFPWYESLDWTKQWTLKQFRDSLFEYLDCQQADFSLPLDSMAITKTLMRDSIDNESTTQLSGLTVIEAICEINGCFGRINESGLFSYTYIRTSEDALFPSDTLYPNDDLFPQDSVSFRFTMNDYISCMYEDYDCQKFTKVLIRKDSSDSGASYGTDGNTYVIDGNFLVADKNSQELVGIAQTFYEENRDVYYTPSNVTTRYKPWLEIGDNVAVITSSSVVYFPILQRFISGITAIYDEYTATGESTFSEQINGQSSELLLLNGKTNQLTRTIDETISLIKGEGGLESQIQQTAEAVSLKVSKDSVISEINQSAEAVSINANKVNLNGYVTVQSLGDGGSTVIDGSRITTGTIEGVGMKTANLEVLNGFEIQANNSGAIAHIDFHKYGSESVDYTTRLLEIASGGVLEILSPLIPSGLGSLICGDVACASIMMGDVQATITNNKTTADANLGTTWVTTGIVYQIAAVASTSDKRLKDNIEDSDVNALDVVNAIKVRQFDWKKDGTHQKVGFVVDELEELDDRFVLETRVSNENYDDIKCVNSFYMQGYLVKAMQEQQKIIEQLEKRVADLEQKLSENGGI